MYDTALIRKLCGEIAEEKDSEKSQELASLLQAVIREDIEDIRTRMAFLRRKYESAFEDSKVA